MRTRLMKTARVDRAIYILDPGVGKNVETLPIGGGKLSVQAHVELLSRAMPRYEDAWDADNHQARLYRSLKRGVLEEYDRRLEEWFEVDRSTGSAPIKVWEKVPS